MHQPPLTGASACFGLGGQGNVQNKETVTSERNSACGGACAASAQQSEKSKPKKRIGLRTINLQEATYDMHAVRCARNAHIHVYLPRLR